MIGTRRLVACLFAASMACARADDLGSHVDVRTIRHDVPVLLATRLQALHAAEPAGVTDVVVLGDDALAAWRAADLGGLMALHRRSDRWWDGGQVDAVDAERSPFDPPGALPQCAGISYPRAFARDALITHLHVSPALADLAAQHIELVRSGAMPASYAAGPAGVMPCPAVAADAMRSLADGYNAVLTFAAMPAPAPQFYTRAPTAGEMSPTPGADAYFFFSLLAQASSPLAISAGTTLDVWVPFALDPSKQYALTMGQTQPSFDRIPVSLANNVLHASLPAFTIAPDGEAMAEIDGDPP